MTLLWLTKVQYSAITFVVKSPSQICEPFSVRASSFKIKKSLYTVAKSFDGNLIIAAPAIKGQKCYRPVCNNEMILEKAEILQKILRDLTSPINS